MSIRLISISTTNCKWRRAVSSFLKTNQSIFSSSSNFLRDYQPINRTTKFLPLHLTFSELSLNKFEAYRELSEDPAKQFGNVRFMKYVAGFFGWFDRRLIQTEHHNDHIRRILIDSDFVLKGLGIFTSKNAGGQNVLLFFALLSVMSFRFAFDFMGVFFSFSKSS